MNEIVNKFLLAGDKFMPKMQPGFTNSACGPFTKSKERIQKFKETGDTNYIYRSELNKACFQHDMAYGYFKDFDKTFNIEIKHLILLKILNMMDINAHLPRWFTNVLIKGPQAAVLIYMPIISILWT